MRQNDPNGPHNHPSSRSPLPTRSPLTRPLRMARASEPVITTVRSDTNSNSLHAPNSNNSNSRRRNTYNINSTMRSPTRPTFRGRPKPPPFGIINGNGVDEDLDALLLSDDESEESSDQKPAAVLMQKVGGGIEAPSIDGPFVSMVRNSATETSVGNAASFPRSPRHSATPRSPRHQATRTSATRTSAAIPEIPETNGIYSSSSRQALPTPTAVPPPRPNQKPVEPSVPASRLGRRCLTRKPKREPDLVKGLVVAGANRTIRARDTVVVNCANCGTEIQIARNAIVVSCPSCYKISPAATCKIQFG